MTWYWLSCPSFTVRIGVDEARVIRWAAPLVRKFIGQPLANLERWAKSEAVKL